MSAPPQSPAPAQHYWTVRGQKVRVPYFVPWSGEKSLPGRLVHRPGPGGIGLGYADEIPGDRFRGVLWVRMQRGQGNGRPHLPGVHPLRQRRCMGFFLCQVCGGPAERADGRHLFVMRAANGLPIAEGERTQTPPVHEECARESVRDCPHLRGTFTAALVEHIPLWGVAGIEYNPLTLRPRAPADGGKSPMLTEVAYEDRSRIGWIQAAREVISLHGVTTVDPADLGLAS
ncbi:hypothetical protein [Streptomyces sp. IB2014 016-6]|uniref:hypothetical protein n=1 Tax=Streptomyces sp. IB2014 016-6 TaxID=2517818 RepID=UPI0011C82457|nr:hypothetical protein [Streptomyces sp. IB2014 016-6]TXL83959.1 hypothetical protein EW053_35950 [Streptomyces sp. IB2014 016-6]